MAHTPFPSGPSGSSYPSGPQSASPYPSAPQGSPFPGGAGYGPPSYGEVRPSLPTSIPQPVKPSKLGVASFWVSIAAFAVGMIACVISLVFQANHNDDGANGAWLGTIPASILGIVGLILGIVAMLNPASRKWGLIGIIVAVAAPILVFGIWATASWAMAG